jgi:hypothetical protein
MFDLCGIERWDILRSSWMYKVYSARSCLANKSELLGDGNDAGISWHIEDNILVIVNTETCLGLSDALSESRYNDKKNMILKNEHLGYIDKGCYLELKNLILCSSQQKCSILETPLLESPSICGHPPLENFLPQ